jgi:hypothetical protein
MKRYFPFIFIGLFLFCSISSAAQKGAVFDFLLNQQRGATASLIGGKAYFYEVGSTTPKTVWLDRNKGSVAANPYTLDSNGTAQLYGDGLYRIVIKNAAGSTIYDRDNLNFVDYLTSGVYQAVQGDYSSLNNAITRIGSTPTTLTINKANFPMTSAAVAPSTLALKIEYPGSIANSTYALTINGATDFPLTQVFTGTGLVTGMKEYNPIHFGADPTYTTNSTVAINKMFASATASEAVVHGYSFNTAPKIKFSPGHYKISDVLTIGTAEWPASTVGMFLDIQGVGGVIIENTDNTKDTFKIPNVHQMWLSGIQFYGGKDLISMSNPNTDSTNIYISSCRFTENAGWAIKAIGTLSPTDTHLSAHLVIDKVHAINVGKFLYTTADKTEVKDSWVFVDSHQFVVPRFNNASTAAIINKSGELTVRDSFMTATPGVGGSRLANVRWVDNYNNFNTYNTRWSGEDNGMPLVYNYAPAFNVAAPYQGYSIIIDGCQVSCNAGNAADSFPIVLKGGVAPQFVRFSGNNYQLGPVFGNPDGTNLAAYLTSATTGTYAFQHVAYEIDQNRVFAYTPEFELAALQPYIYSTFPITGKWTPFTYVNSWVDEGSGTYYTASYARLGNVIKLRGRIKNGTVGTQFATLPVGSRPLKECDFITASSNGIAVTSGGLLFVLTGVNTSVVLDGIEFPAEQ